MKHSVKTTDCERSWSFHSEFQKRPFLGLLIVLVNAVVLSNSIYFLTRVSAKSEKQMICKWNAVHLGGNECDSTKIEIIIFKVQLNM